MPTAASKLPRPNNSERRSISAPSAPSLPLHSKRFLQDSRRRLGQLVLSQLFFAREGHFRHVASRHRLPANPFTQIIHDHIMESRPLLPFRRSSRALQINSIKHFYQLNDAHGEPCFFSQLSRHAFLQRLAQLQHSSRNRPFSKQRLAPAPNQQRATLVDDYSSHAHHRAFRVLSRRRHLAAISFPPQGFIYSHIPCGWG